MAAVDHRPRSGVIALLCWALLLALIAATLEAAVRTPAAVPASAASTDFSSARAMAPLEQIAQRPHPVGSADHERVKAYLVAQMEDLGLETTTETYTGVEGRGNTVVAARVSNVIGRLKGTDNSRAVVLAAHYDSVDRAPGAGDDGGGVAAILETIRAIEAGPRLKNDVIVLFTDGEELGLLGARAAAVHDPWLENTGVLFNFEGRGDQGPSAMFETSGGNRGLIREFIKVAPFKTGSSLLYTIYKLLPNDTDFTVFRKVGLAGLNFAWVGRLEAYHSRLDTPANLDQRSLQQDGTYALCLTRAFGDLDLNKFPLNDDGDAVYFNLFGRHMLHYPGNMVLPFSGLFTIALAVVLLGGVRRGRFSGTRILKATAAAFLILVAVPLAMAAVTWCLNHLFSSRMLVGDDPSNTWLFVATLLVGIATTLALLRAFHRRWGTMTLLAGSTSLVWLLTALMTYKIPDASYLIFWPLVFSTASLAWIISRNDDGSWSAFAASWLGAIPAVLFLAPTLKFFFVGLTLSMTLALLSGVLLAIGLLLIVPLVDLLAPASRATSVIASSVGCAIMAVIIGLVLSHPSAAHPAPDTLAYRMDAASGKAQWASLDEKPDAWTQEMLTRSPQHGKLQYFGPKEGDALLADAPPMPLVAPVVTVTESTQTGDVRTVQLRLSSGRHAPWLHLRLGPDTQVLAATINGEPIPDWPTTTKTARGPWAFNLFGFNDSGVALSLQFKSLGCSATLSDETYGLPDFTKPRPLDRMAWYGSDYTIVTREVSIC